MKMLMRVPQTGRAAEPEESFPLRQLLLSSCWRKPLMCDAECLRRLFGGIPPSFRFHHHCSNQTRERYQLTRHVGMPMSLSDCRRPPQRLCAGEAGIMRAIPLTVLHRGTAVAARAGRRELKRQGHEGARLAGGRWPRWRVSPPRTSRAFPTAALHRWSPPRTGSAPPPNLW